MVEGARLESVYTVKVSRVRIPFSPPVIYLISMWSQYKIMPNLIEKKFHDIINYCLSKKKYNLYKISFFLRI